MKEDNKYYFTFVYGHPMKEIGDYVEIIARTKREAIGEMERNFNRNWTAFYTEEEWNGRAEEFGYKKVLTIEVLKV